MNALIFSKNRPCQLDALVRSVKESMPTLFETMTVLYKADELTYHVGYEKFFDTHTDVKKQVETHLQSNLMFWLRENLGETWFFLDDQLYYKTVPPVPFFGYKELRFLSCYLAEPTTIWEIESLYHRNKRRSIFEPHNAGIIELHNVDDPGILNQLWLDGWQINLEQTLARNQPFASRLKTTHKDYIMERQT